MEKIMNLRNVLNLFLSFFLIIGCASLQNNSTSKNNLVENLSLEDAKKRKDIVENPAYNISMQLDDKSNEFKGVTTLSFIAKRTDVDLRIDFIGGKILSLFANDSAIEPQYNNVFVTLPKQYLKLGHNKVIIEYSHPYATNARGLHRFLDKEDGRVYVWTQFEPFEANRMFPCFDQPDLKARFTLTVDAPKKWAVISAERESTIQPINSELNKWIFPQTDLFSTYIFSLHAGEFKVWEDRFNKIPLRLFVRKSLAPYINLKEWMNSTKFGLNFYPEYFGTPFPYKKYDQIIVPESTFGAMENVGAVTFHEKFVSRGQKTKDQIRDLEMTILHEMAHMWFGNLVTMKWWDDLWLNESFATYMSTVALANSPGKKDGTWVYFNETKEWAYEEDKLVTTHPIVTPVGSTDQAFANFDGITYGKGASSLKQLVYYIGEDKFKKGLQLYFKSFAYKNTELKDFINSLSSATGISLSDWQNKWLLTSGVNTLEVSFDCNKNNTLKSLKITQRDENKNTIVRPHKVNIALFDFEKDPSRPFENIQYLINNQTHDLVIKPNLSCPNMIYPNFEDFGYLSIKLDPVSLNSVEKNIGKIQNVLFSRMLWQDLWGMVLEGKYDIKSYGELALENAKNVKDPVLFRSVLKINEIYHYYPKKSDVEVAIFKDFVKRSEAFLLSILTSKKYSSDFKKEAFILLTDTGLNVESQNHFLSLLALKSESNGLNIKIDQDMRWMMVKSLVRNGNAKSIELLEKEKLRDPSAQGLKEYYSAQSGIPDWKQKEIWIQELKKAKSEYSLDILKSVARNIFPSHQTQFRKIYGKDYFADFKNVLKNPDMMQVANFTLLAPTFCEADESDLIEGFLKNSKNLTPMASKRLKISRQESQRCTKIREFSRKNGTTKRI
jgi:aminopeptidase N